MQNLHGPPDTAQQLIALLDRHRDELADSWVKAIREEMPDARYSQRPPAEIRANNLNGLAMLKDLLQGTKPGTVWERRADLGVPLEYAQLGIDVSEIVMAALLLEDVIRPIVRSTIPRGTPGSQLARTEVRRHVHLFAQDIVRGYADVVDQYLREQQQRTALMLEITRTVGRSLDLDTVLQRAAQGIAAAAGAQHCLLYLLDKSGSSGALWAATDEFPPALTASLQRFMDRRLDRPTTSLVRLVLETKQPLVCYDAQTDPRVHYEFVQSLGIRSVLEVPSVLKGRVLAVAIVVTLDACHDFGQEQVDLAWGIANAVAPAIENARLHEKVEHLATLEERARLARELHDDLAQALGALQLRASLLNDTLSPDRNAQARAYLLELQDMISQAYRQVDEAIFNLRAMISPATSFAALLQEYLADYRLYYGLEVALETDAEAAVVLVGTTGAQVIRIIQEALTNSRKHARARQAWVRIERLDGSVRVSVEDDGQGFEPSVAFSQDQPHFGLQVMRERAEKVGGRLLVDSPPGKGTRVELLLPCPPSGGQS